MSVRFNLLLSDELGRQIEEFATTTEDKATLIRKALAIYLAAVRARRDEGLGIALFDPATREIRTEIVGL
jgi:predicted transcriptional regulator